MAIEKSKLRLDGRHDLDTVLLLATPYSIYLDPASACNFKCVFVPLGIRICWKAFTKISDVS